MLMILYVLLPSKSMIRAVKFDDMDDCEKKDDDNRDNFIPCHQQMETWSILIRSWDHFLAHMLPYYAQRVE